MICIVFRLCDFGVLRLFVSLFCCCPSCKSDILKYRMLCFVVLVPEVIFSNFEMQGLVVSGRGGKLFAKIELLHLPGVGHRGKNGKQECQINAPANITDSKKCKKCGTRIFFIKCISSFSQSEPVSGVEMLKIKHSVLSTVVYQDSLISGRHFYLEHPDNSALAGSQTDKKPDYSVLPEK